MYIWTYNTDNALPDKHENKTTKKSVYITSQQDTILDRGEKNPDLASF